MPVDRRAALTASGSVAAVVPGLFVEGRIGTTPTVAFVGFTAGTWIRQPARSPGDAGVDDEYEGVPPEVPDRLWRAGTDLARFCRSAS